MSAQATEIPARVTVLGHEYVLCDGEGMPTWERLEGGEIVRLIGYPSMWRALVSVSHSGATIMLHGCGPTPEAALLALPEAYATLDARLTDLAMTVAKATMAGLPGAQERAA